MYIERINRADQTGFWLRYNRGVFLIAFHHWKEWSIAKQRHFKFPAWLFVLNFGSGAGTTSKFFPKGGVTFFLGWRARGGMRRTHDDHYRPIIPPKFRIGLTRCANRVPYGFGR